MKFKNTLLTIGVATVIRMFSILVVAETDGINDTPKQDAQKELTLIPIGKALTKIIEAGFSEVEHIARTSTGYRSVALNQNKERTMIMMNHNGEIVRVVSASGDRSMMRPLIRHAERQKAIQKEKAR